MPPPAEMQVPGGVAPAILQERDRDRSGAEGGGDTQAARQGRINAFLVFVVGVGAIAGFLYGYDTGIISGALLTIREDFAIDHRMQELVTSAILVGAVAGALAGGW